MASPYTGMTQAEYDRNRYDPRRRRNAFLQKKYGITIEEYEEIWSGQSGCCAICGDAEAEAMVTHKYLVVDHDHETGEVRGLLCDLCNKGLGQFRDDATRLRSALRYLEGEG